MANFTQAYIDSTIASEFETPISVDNNLPRRPGIRVSVQKLPFEVQVGVAIFCGLLTLSTVTGNLVVLFSFATTKKLRTYANYFICGLAVIDLVDGAFALPLFSIYWILGEWPFSQELCEAYRYMNHIIMHSSYLFTLVICIDRYQALTQPLKHLQRRSKRRAVSMMSVAFSITALSWIGPVIIWPKIGKNVPPQYSTSLCYPHYSRTPFAIFANVYIAWLPLILICCMYIRIYVILRQRSAAMEVKQQHTQIQQQIKTVSASVSGVVKAGFNNMDDDLAGNSRPISSVPAVGQVKRDNTTKAYNQIDQQNIKATRVLSLIVAVMIVARVPWSVLSLIQIFCGLRCGIPINLYQVK